jgi:hypothetical protein
MELLSRLRQALVARTDPRTRTGTPIRRVLLYAAVVWLVGIQAYFYVDLLIERRDQVSSVLNRLRDLFG